MLRTELVEKLDVISPALATYDLIPILKHFWFTGSQLMAFNDQIAISVNYETDFTGAVPGAIFLNLLKNSRSKEFEFEPSGSELHGRVKSKKQRGSPLHLKLPLLPESDFTLEMPEISDDVIEVHPLALVDAIRCCMRSTSLDTSQPDQLGVTVIPKGMSLNLYATNDETISHAEVELQSKTKLKERVVLSAQFCKQLIKLITSAINKAGKKPDFSKIMQLEITDNHSLLTTSEGYSLFGRLLEVSKPVEFEDLIERHLPKNLDKVIIPMPSKLQHILNRAVIVVDGAVERTTTKVKIQDEVARFLSKTDTVEVKDSLSVKNHPDISISINPKLLKEGYGDFDDILFTERCVIMRNETQLYLVAAVDS